MLILQPDSLQTSSERMFVFFGKLYINFINFLVIVNTIFLSGCAKPFYSASRYYAVQFFSLPLS